MKQFMCAALAASAFLCTVAAAQAEDAQMRVKLADLNMATEAGAKTALARIEFSAANFCEKGMGRETLDRASVTDRCVAEMTTKSVRQLHAPLVTALLKARVGADKPSRLAMAQ
jgi:UrcA family protein